MGIEEILYYQVTCDFDDCTSLFIGNDGQEEFSMIDEAETAGWTERDGKWFCPEHSKEKD